jgi:hypothetical protein
MKTTFTEFVNSILKESQILNNIDELNESAIILSRDFLKEIGEIAKPLFAEISDNIDETTSFSKLYHLLNSELEVGFFSEFARALGLSSSGIMEKTKETELNLRNHINSYIKSEYLDNSDLTDEQKKKLLLSQFSIKPNISWNSVDFNHMLHIHMESNAEGYKGGEDSCLKSIMKNDDDIKAKLEDEFERFSEFYDISTGAGFVTQYNSSPEKNPSINNIKFIFGITFEYSLILYYTFIVLSKYGLLKKSIEEMINQFISKRFVPFVLHEITHYIQTLKPMIDKKIFVTNNKRYKDIGDRNFKSQDEVDSWFVTYLSEPIEIGAHSSEFVETLIANYPDMSFTELMDMFKKNEIPLNISPAIDKYLNQLIQLSKERGINPDKTINRFKKTVYDILQKYAEQERTKNLS